MPSAVPDEIAASPCSAISAVGERRDDQQAEQPADEHERRAATALSARSRRAAPCRTPTTHIADQHDAGRRQSKRERQQRDAGRRARRSAATPSEREREPDSLERARARGRWNSASDRDDQHRDRRVEQAQRWSPSMPARPEVDERRSAARSRAARTPRTRGSRRAAPRAIAARSRQTNGSRHTSDHDPAQQRERDRRHAVEQAARGDRAAAPQRRRSATSAA